MCVEEKANVCEICREGFVHSVRHPKQKICFNKYCKKAHKAKWQKARMENDIDYFQNQKQANENWRKNNPDYSKTYRENHPKSVLRNQLTQKIRNLKRVTAQRKHPVKNNEMIARMDLVKPAPIGDGAEFWLVPVTAKMDPVKVLFLINTRLASQNHQF